MAKDQTAARIPHLLQDDRETFCKHVRDGIAAKREKGGIHGRAQQIPDVVILTAMRRVNGGEAVVSVAADIGISKSTYYKRLKEI